MSFTEEYITNEPTRHDVDDLAGAVVLEFGNSWCGFCQRAEPMIKEALTQHNHVRHIRIADGSGRPLGRSFRVKLWPTFIFLQEGRETSRLVRPGNVNSIQAALDQIDPA